MASGATDPADRAPEFPDEHCDPGGSGSTSTTRLPAWTSSCATHNPTTPAPMTATSWHVSFIPSNPLHYVCVTTPDGRQGGDGTKTLSHRGATSLTYHKPQYEKSVI